MAPKCEPARSPSYRFCRGGRLGGGSSNWEAQAGGWVGVEKAVFLGPGSEREEKYRKGGVFRGGLGTLGAGIGGWGIFLALRDCRWKILTCCGLLTFGKVAFCRFLCPCQASPPPSCPLPTRGWRAWEGGGASELLRGRFLEGFLAGR